jgi:hypothetical protein
VVLSNLIPEHFAGDFPLSFFVCAFPPLTLWKLLGINHIFYKITTKTAVTTNPFAILLDSNSNFVDPCRQWKSQPQVSSRALNISPDLSKTFFGIWETLRSLSLVYIN